MTTENAKPEGMSEGMAQLFEECARDARFRELLRTDPDRAISEKGIKLTEEEQAGVKAKVGGLPWERPTDELVSHARSMYA